MCGIFGYIGPKNASEVVLEGLKRLEYRGYDSAGVCVLAKDNKALLRRTPSLTQTPLNLPKSQLT